MSTAVTLTPAGMVTEAGRILADVGTPGTWPQHPHAQAAIGYAYERLLECLDIHARLLDGSLDNPYAVHAPDMGWWPDPELNAVEWMADEALEAAKALRNRLAEWQRREGSARS